MSYRWELSSRDRSVAVITNYESRVDQNMLDLMVRFDAAHGIPPPRVKFGKITPPPQTAEKFAVCFAKPPKVMKSLVFLYFFPKKGKLLRRQTRTSKKLPGGF